MIYREIVAYDRETEAVRTLFRLGDFVTVLGKLFWISRIERPDGPTPSRVSWATSFHLEEHDADTPPECEVKELKFRPEWDFIYHMKGGEVLDIVGDCFKKVV